MTPETPDAVTVRRCPHCDSSQVAYVRIGLFGGQIAAIWRCAACGSHYDGSARRTPRPVRMYRVPRDAERTP